MTFEKSVHAALWGIESWEISAHTSDPGEIADGEEKGHRLNEIYPNFPLLVKVIDAKTRLSVQVHPNEETCKVTGGEPKTEMWCALSDGLIYAGLVPGTTAADVEACVGEMKKERALWAGWHAALFDEYKANKSREAEFRSKEELSRKRLGKIGAGGVAYAIRIKRLPTGSVHQDEGPSGKEGKIK